MAKLVNYNRQNFKTPMPVLDPIERAHTFSEVTLGYSADQAVNEARRCIQCESRPCVAGCPVGVPVREFVAHIARRDFAAAYAAVKDANALPAICGRVCPQETQCEGVCMRGRKGEPVGIGRLERFIADWAAEHPQEAARALADRRLERARIQADPARVEELEREGFIVSLTGKGSFVAGANTELIREEHLRRLEDHLREAVSLSHLCGLDLDGLTSILSMLYKEEDL